MFENSRRAAPANPDRYGCGLTLSFIPPVVATRLRQFFSSSWECLCAVEERLSVKQASPRPGCGGRPDGTDRGMRYERSTAVGSVSVSRNARMRDTSSSDRSTGASVLARAISFRSRSELCTQMSRKIIGTALHRIQGLVADAGSAPHRLDHGIERRKLR